MPSARHEALVDLFRERPSLAWELLAHQDPAAPRPQGAPQVVEAAFSTLELPTYAADLVLDDGVGPLLIVEVQLRHDPSKGWVWPLYLAALAHRHRRPALLLIDLLLRGRLHAVYELGLG
jgi:hypothetical protein